MTVAETKNNTKKKTTSEGPSSSSAAKKPVTAKRTGGTGRTDASAKKTAVRQKDADTAAKKASAPARKPADAEPRKPSATRDTAKNPSGKSVKRQSGTGRPPASARTAAAKNRKTGKKHEEKKLLQLKIGWKAIAAISAAILALILFPIFLRKSAETGARVPQGLYGKYVIDISHHNGKNIKWDSLYVMTDIQGRTTLSKDHAVSIKKVDMAYIKATEGESMKDREFSGNWKKAGRAPLKRGAYHFFRSSKDAAAQADNFIRTVGTLSYRDLPPMLDIETMHRGCDKALLNRRALEWLQIVESHYKRKPVVYTSESYAEHILSREILDNYPLWVAHYGVESPEREQWDLWQFTDRAVIYGLPGKGDLSIWRNSR